jgi:UDP-N-acetylglucosamine:LPS N-acetylglucosamine transferase
MTSSPEVGTPSAAVVVPPGPAPIVLVLTASIGEGHNRAAEALVVALGRARPGCRVRVVDVVARTGARAESILRMTYTTTARWTPLTYELWYYAVAHLAWVRWIYADPVGARVAQVVAAEVDQVRPDLVVSTYPLATAAACWLRRRGRLAPPLVAVLSDFAPHAFWLYPGVDEYLVVDESGRRRVREQVRSHVPRPRVTVAGPPVLPSFDLSAPRRPHALAGQAPDDALVVLISCGSMGLGAVVDAVRAALAAGPRCRVVAVCGRNESLRAALKARRHDRLHVVGWTSEMASLMATADVVVNNAGGLTVAEALAAGRALVMFKPLPGHGRDSAAALRRAGLAVVHTRSRGLTRQLTWWLRNRRHLHAQQARTARFASAHRFDQAVGAVLGRVTETPSTLRERAG